MAYTIVSFCGGGIRGLMSAKILHMLTEYNQRIVANTSLFAGTSTGAGIVSNLIKYNPALDPSAFVGLIVDSFYLQAADFYSNPGANPSVPAYQNTKFVNAMKDLHGTTPLSSLRQQVLFTAFSLGSENTPWQPLLLTNVPNAPVPTSSTTVVDAVVSSGSMPGMLPSYQGNVDGAFIHHDPTLAAIALAVNSGVALDEIAAICIGTGFMANWIGSDTTQWGVEQWLNGDGTQNYQLPDLLLNEAGVCPILNLCLNGTSTNLIPMLSSMLLPGRYVYLNPVLEHPIPENAHTEAQLQYLASCASRFPADHPETWQKAQSLLSTYW